MSLLGKWVQTLSHGHQLNFARWRSGTMAVEFALTLPFYVAILLYIVETGYVALQRAVIEGAVASASREIRTGSTQISDNPLAQFRQTLCREASTVVDCSKLSLDVRNFSTIPDPAAIPPVAGGVDSFSAGDAESITLVRVLFEWQYISPGLQRALSPGGQRFVVSTIFKVEPFRRTGG